MTELTPVKLEQEVLVALVDTLSVSTVEEAFGFNSVKQC
jgi:hypothetical protein